MPVPLIVAGAALAVATVGTVASIGAQNKMARAEQNMVAVQRQQTDLQGLRQRMDAIRSGRDAFANIQQNAENQGVAMSSNAVGGESSVLTQMMSNVSFLDVQNKLTDTAEQYSGEAMRYQAQANMWSAVENFGFRAADLGFFSFGHGEW